jgi:hypothetical protein
VKTSPGFAGITVHDAGMGVHRSRQHLVKLVDTHGIELRQNYNCEAPRMALKVGRYAHAKQFKRMNRKCEH